MAYFKMGKTSKFFSVVAFSFSIFSCATHTKKAPASETIQTQYFIGKIQVGSLDGKTPYGPPYESVVRRVVNAADGMVEECVLQKGQLFYTLITRTKEPLVYLAVDSDGSFSGNLSFADSSLSSWSYSIQVIQPNKGSLTGNLPEHGAKINFQTKTMSIRKIWDNKILISEEYDMTDLATYKDKLMAAKASNPALIIRETCK